MKLAALTILLLPMSLRATPVDPQVHEALSAMRDGSPATLEGASLAQAREDLVRAATAFTQTLDQQKLPGSPACDRFNAIAGATARDIVKTLPQFTGTDLRVDRPTSVYAEVRLQLELPAFELLARLVGEGKEGGYGFLIRYKSECKYKSRETTATAFSNLAQRFKDFRSHALGAPGLLGFERQTELLLQLANRAETRQDRISTAFMVGQFVASWGAWKYLKPVAKTAFASALGATGSRLLTSNFFIVGATVGAIYTETKIWNGVGRAVVPSFAERPDEDEFQIRLPGWDEALKDTEFLINSSLAEPHLYLSYLSAVKAEMALVFNRWRNAHDEQLKAAAETDPEFQRRLAEALWLAREATFLKRESPSLAAQQLPLLIAKDWNFNVACGADKFFKPHPVRCLIGLRRIARALYSGALVPPKPGIAELVLVNVTNAKEFRIVSEDARVRIDVPYKRPFEQTAPLIAAAYESSPVRVLSNFVTQFLAALEAWNKTAPQTLEFDPALSLRDQWSTLNNLVRIRDREPGLFERRSEVLVVGQRFRALSERRLKLHEQIEAGASLERITDFLRRTNQTSVTEPEVTRFARLRAEVTKAARALGQSLEIDVQCSDQKILTLQRCLTTINRVAEFKRRYPKFRPVAHVMLVTDILEVGESFELVQTPDDPNKLIWAVSAGFKMDNLHRAASDRSWFGEVTPAS